MMMAGPYGGGLLDEDMDDAGGPADAAQDATELPEAAPRNGQQQRQHPVAFGNIGERAQRGVAAMHSQLLAIFAECGGATKLRSQDAVKFFMDVERKEDNKQQLKGTCKACGKSVTSTGSSRLVTHMTKCPLVPAPVNKAFQDIMKQSSSKASGKREAEMIAAQDAEVFAKKFAAEQAVLKQTGIKASFHGAEKAWADRCIAEFFYANAIPFSVANTDPGGLYRRMITAIKATPAGYKPPNYQRLGNDLLDTCWDGMWKSINERDPDGALARKYGATYVTDGWDSCDNLSLINSAFISNNNGGIFWRSVDTSGKVKNAEYTAALMIADIYSYGPTKVVLVCTDTCAVMQKAWDIVGYEFPWVSCLPCQPHVISLLLKDIGKTPEVRSPFACLHAHSALHAHSGGPHLPKLLDVSHSRARPHALVCTVYCLFLFRRR